MKIGSFGTPLFVTVGTSGLTNERIGLVPPVTSNEVLLGQVGEYLADTTKVKERPDSYRMLMDDLCTAHRLLWGQPAEFLSGAGPAGRRNHRATSAELWSTYKLAQWLPELGIDGIVLISSDTGDGKFAARLNQAVIRSREYLARLPWRLLGVEIEIVEGLDARVKNPAEALQALFKKHTDGALVRINLTGGFKGLAAHIGELAGTNDYHYFYLHESLLEPFFVLTNPSTVSSNGCNW